MIARIISPADGARGAKREIEAALDDAGWPWRRRLSLWVDTLVMIAGSTTSS